MTKSKQQSKKEPIDMIFDLIDTINESVKHLHDRIDNTQKQIDGLIEASKLSSELHKGSNETDNEIVKMVNRMAKRMGME
tara:strand:+ start:207 stop:446 length:240 start_codon:yes stop_codon:yes gene_type:complete